MKKNVFKIISFLLVVLGLLINGCSLNENKSPYKEETKKLITYLTETNHTVRKMQNRTSIDQKINSSNYFIFSSFSIENKSESVIMFSFFDSISQTYHIISVPISKVRISFSGDSLPSVQLVLMESLFEQFLNQEYSESLYTRSFEGKHGYISPKEVFMKKTQTIFNSYLSYIIINCRESDWPTTIELPLNTAPE